MTLLKLVQIHILWLLEDGCSCRVWCVLFHSESNNCYGNSGQCMIVSAQKPKWQWMVLVYYSRYCYETTIHHTIYLIIWHYIYIYCSRLAWILDISLICVFSYGDQKQDHKQKILFLKAITFRSRVQFQDLPPDCTGLWNDVWRADRHLGRDLP